MWLINFGIKTTCQFVKLYPGYFLLGIFSPFMISGEVQNDGQIKTMTISTKWTWINFLLSIIGSISGSFAIMEFIIIIFCMPTFVLAAICLALLFFSEKLCSSCCKVNLPIVYKTGVNINDFFHIINLQTGQE